MKYKVSVIIPVYNAAQYLRKCIESLMQQTLTDVEYIFINDASTDQSLSIIQEYARQYPHRYVKIVDLKQNGGISNARNTGLSYATGEYVTHCDSDDWLETDAYEKMYQLAQSTEADIVSCDFIHEYSNRQKICHQPYSPERDENIRRMLNGEIFPSLWVSLIRREIIAENRLRFPEGLNMGEDLLFNVQVFYYSSTFVSTTKPFYHYRHSENSVCVRRSRKSIDSDIAIAGLIERFLKEKGLIEHFEKAIAYRKFFSKMALISTFTQEADYQDWLQIYPETHKHIWSFTQIDLKLRLQLWLAAHHQFRIAQVMRGLLIKQKKIRSKYL